MTQDRAETHREWEAQGRRNACGTEMCCDKDMSDEKFLSFGHYFEQKRSSLFLFLEESKCEYTKSGNFIFEQNTRVKYKSPHIHLPAHNWSPNVIAGKICRLSIRPVYQLHCVF